MLEEAKRESLFSDILIFAQLDALSCLIMIASHLSSNYFKESIISQLFGYNGMYVCV